MKERIQHIIKAESLTNLQFAQLIESSPATVTHLLSGRNKPSVEMVANIARAFPHYNLRWLILGEGAIYNKGVNETAQASVTTQPQTSDELLFGDNLQAAEVKISQSTMGAISTNSDKQASAHISTGDTQQTSAPEISATKLIVCLPDGTFSEYTRK